MSTRTPLRRAPNASASGRRSRREPRVPIKQLLEHELNASAHALLRALSRPSSQFRTPCSPTSPSTAAPRRRLQPVRLRLPAPWGRRASSVVLRGPTARRAARPATTENSRTAPRRRRRGRRPPPTPRRRPSTPPRCSRSPPPPPPPPSPPPPPTPPPPPPRRRRRRRRARERGAAARAADGALAAARHRRPAAARPRAHQRTHAVAEARLAMRPPTAAWPPPPAFASRGRRAGPLADVGRRRRARELGGGRCGR